MFRLPVNSRKIQDLKKVDKVWLCQEFKIRACKFQDYFKKALNTNARKKLSCSKKQDGKISKKKDEAYSKRFKEKALGKQCRLKELTMYVSL